jgi:hypothetical protein
VIFTIEKELVMKAIWLILILASSFCAFAQEGGNAMFQSIGVVDAMAWADKGPAVVKGAPYSATTNSESVQTLGDGNRIAQTSTGTVARDSQGRTRQDATLPAIGNLSAASAPHLVFIQDPVGGASYTLNLTDKTAWKSPPFPPGAGGQIAVGGGNTFFATTGNDVAGPPPPMHGMVVAKHLMIDEPSEATTEQLGSQTMEGVMVNGVRTKRTIPAGQIGNDRPIYIVTEIWTSPDLKAIVSSKRSDPRMGEQTFNLTNIVRGEPDPSLFTVPADYKIIERGPKTIMYRTNQ